MHTVICFGVPSGRCICFVACPLEEVFVRGREERGLCVIYSENAGSHCYFYFFWKAKSRRPENPPKTLYFFTLTGGSVPDLRTTPMCNSIPIHAVVLIALFMPECGYRRAGCVFIRRRAAHCLCPLGHQPSAAASQHLAKVVAFLFLVSCLELLLL